MFCWPCCVMLVGTALYIRLLVCAGLSLFIISRLYVYMVVCVVYAYNLTIASRGSNKVADSYLRNFGNGNNISTFLNF